MELIFSHVEVYRVLQRVNGKAARFNGRDSFAVLDNHFAGGINIG